MAEANKKTSEKELMATKNLPEVIIEDILLRLPVKSLLRFRCVCKPWCVLIADLDFVKKHLSRSLAYDSNRSLIFLRSPFYSVDLDACEMQAAIELDHPLKSPHHQTKIGGSCNGLLCIYNSAEDILLWNPSTRRHRKLPVSRIESPEQYDTCSSIDFGLGYNPSSDDYKLVRIAQFDCDHLYSYSISEVKVYSLNSNSWRKIGYMTQPFHLSSHRGFGVLANSALHWLGTQTWPIRPDWPDYTAYSRFIVSIDLQYEEYREFPLPECLDAVAFKINVGVRGGQLCVLCNFYRVLYEVWVMKDYGMKDSWVKEFSIGQSVISSFNDIIPVCYSKSGEVILENDFEALVLYDPSRGSVRNLRIRGAPERIEARICIGSLIPLDAKDGTEQAETKKKNTKKKKKKKNRGINII